MKWATAARLSECPRGESTAPAALSTHSSLCSHLIMNEGTKRVRWGKWQWARREASSEERGASVHWEVPFSCHGSVILGRFLVNKLASLSLPSSLSLGVTCRFPSLRSEWNGSGWAVLHSPHYVTHSFLPLPYAPPLRVGAGPWLRHGPQASRGNEWSEWNLMMDGLVPHNTIHLSFSFNNGAQGTEPSMPNDKILYYNYYEGVRSHAFQS